MIAPPGSALMETDPPMCSIWHRICRVPNHGCVPVILRLVAVVPGPRLLHHQFPRKPRRLHLNISLWRRLCFYLGSLFLTNITTGASTNISLSAPAGSALAGNSAEWIVEAPTVNGSQTQLPDYGEVFFNNCEAYTSTGLTVKGGTGHTINLGFGNKSSRTAS